MTNVKVSVCVSVFNGERFLQRCLDSLCAQTLESLEIVVVNDGSTDNSAALIKQYIENHPDRNFIYVDQENKGLAQGRQTGVNHASGEFIAFLDQDDYVTNTAYERLLAEAEQHHVDIVEMATISNGKIMQSPYQGVHNAHDILRRFFTKGDVLTMLWLRLYKRSLFEKSVFPELTTNNEDMFALPCLLHVANTIYFAGVPLHTYSVDNEGSYMFSLKANSNKNNSQYNSYKKRLLSFDHFTRFVGESEMQEYKKEFDMYRARYLFGFLMSTFKGVSTKEKKECATSVMHFFTYKELSKFLKTNLCGFKQFLYSMFGYHISYYVFFFIHRLKG